MDLLVELLPLGLVLVAPHIVSLQYSERLRLQVACFSNLLDDSASRPDEADVPTFKLSYVVPVLRFLVIPDVVNEFLGYVDE
jgi:hypothetical protein